MQILQFRWQVVSNHFHSLERRLVEVRRLPVHHLYDHDSQRPDIHLDTERRVSEGGDGRRRADPHTERSLSVTSGPYGSLDMSSGAIQYGVPTRDFLLCTSLDTWAQNPKSDSFTCRQAGGRRRGGRGDADIEKRKAETGTLLLMQLLCSF